LIFKFLCVVFLTKGQHSSNDVFYRADSLYKQQNFTIAAIEYERIIFEEEFTDFKIKAILQKAQCYKNQNKFLLAATYLQDYIPQLPFYFKEKYNFFFQSAFDFILAKEPANAILTLEKLTNEWPDSANNKDILLLNIFAHNDAQQWNKGAGYFIKYASLYDKKVLLNNPYDKKPVLKSEDKAEKLSTYLPLTAAGIFYAGKPLEGVLNSLLQIGFLSLGVQQFLIKNYITSVLIGGGMYTSFYLGGSQRAKTLVRQYNKKKIQKFNNSIKNILLNK
jgi:hypothetical protein